MSTAPASVTITSALVHYGLPTVHVEPYRTFTFDQEIEIHDFYQNGGMICASGYKVKKNGETYARSMEFVVAVPAAVRDALKELKT